MKNSEIDSKMFSISADHKKVEHGHDAAADHSHDHDHKHGRLNKFVDLKSISML